MLMRTFLLTAIFVAGLPAYADLITSVTCHSLDNGYIRSTSSCNIEAGGQTVRVSAEGSYYLPPVPEILSALVGGNANAYPGVGANAGYAEGNTSLNLSLYTLGPVRPGLARVQLAFQNNGTGNYAYDNFFSVDSYAKTCSGPTCSFDDTIPFTLGVPFRVSLLDSLTTFGDVGSQINVSLTTGLTVFERTGTPIQIYAAPETTWLVVPGLSIVAWQVSRRKACKVGRA